MIKPTDILIAKPLDARDQLQPQPQMVVNRELWEPKELELEPKELDLAPYEIVIKTIPTELAESVHELLVAMNRAACDLEHQGQRSQRIAVQLLTAMATFTAKTGLE